MTLWLSMAAISVFAALWLTRPLWRRSTRPQLSRSNANVLAYSSRLQELDADVRAGVLPADEAAPVQQEMEARLLGDTAIVPPTLTAEAPRFTTAAVLLALLLPLAAGLWYWQAGSWRTASLIAMSPADGAAPDRAQIEAMVSQLAERLASKPNDPDGFAMLGRSYFVMGRHADAAKAYATANELSQGGNPAWLVAEGEALALSRDRDLLGRPAQLFDAALQLTPDDGKALWYGALADAQAGQARRAAERLRALLKQQLPDDLRTVALARLDELKAAGPEAVDPAGTGTAAARPAAAAGSADDHLSVRVSISPSLAQSLPANATLFVFAKAAAGPPMPLAVQKLAGARLPLTVRLDDSMAMTPALKLSGFERYVVTARLSVSGNAIAASGDYEGSAEALRGARSPVRVEIERVLP